MWIAATPSAKGHPGENFLIGILPWMQFNASHSNQKKGLRNEKHYPKTEDARIDGIKTGGQFPVCLP